MKSLSASVLVSDREVLAERGRQIAATLPPGSVRDAWEHLAEDIEAGSVSDGAAEALATITAWLGAVDRIKN